ncbi:helix-turn-helix domain-containing protein [Chryseobacterium sp. IT-36CA2]|uniref:helix-turn-helix domain-containing protein n=1 Tax=Chryseobacterium sp. IT-36CA2 TaxID=3026460 RepID=UPI0039E02B2A
MERYHDSLDRKFGHFDSRKHRQLIPQGLNYQIAKANITKIIQIPTCGYKKNKNMQKIVEYKVIYFDYIFIQHVKRIREKQGLSQEQLSLKMGLSKSFVGSVENLKERHKYSTRHITLLANALGYANISKLMNIPTPEFDKVKLTIQVTLNKSGTKTISSEVINITPF